MVKDLRLGQCSGRELESQPGPGPSTEPALVDGRKARMSSSVVGRQISDLVSEMLNNDPTDDNGLLAVPAHASIQVAWPPTFAVGSAGEAVEIRLAMSYCRATGEDSTGTSGALPTLTAAAAATGVSGSCCGRVVAVREDLVVGEEGVQLDSRGATAVARLRLHAEQPGVTSCILADDKGIPTLESLQDAAPLLGLPQAARDEAHRLLWRMMHEALPPNHSQLPFDPEAFRSPLDTLPPKIKAALSWAWCQHFRFFANDLSFLLDCIPAPPQPTHAAASGGSYDSAPQEYDEEYDRGVEHYQAVLAQVVSFLRDNGMFACLATLLQGAVARGLQLLVDGAGALPDVTSMLLLSGPGPAAPPSPSAASDDAVYEDAPDLTLTSFTAVAAACEAPPPPAPAAAPEAATAAASDHVGAVGAHTGPPSLGGPDTRARDCAARCALSSCKATPRPTTCLAPSGGSSCWGPLAVLLLAVILAALTHQVASPAACRGAAGVLLVVVAAKACAARGGALPLAAAGVLAAARGRLRGRRRGPPLPTATSGDRHRGGTDSDRLPGCTAAGNFSVAPVGLDRRLAAAVQTSLAMWCASVAAAAAVAAAPLEAAVSLGAAALLLVDSAPIDCRRTATSWPADGELHPQQG